MRWLLFFGSLLFVTLFLVTTFSHSDAARAEASLYFPNDVIERGLQYSFERRLFFWLLFALRLGFLVLLVTTGLARRVTDWCHARTGQRWFATVVLVGLLYFLADALLVLPFGIARFYHLRAWGLTERAFLDWLSDHGKGLALAAVTDGIVLIGLYLLLRRLPKLWWLPAAAAGTTLAIAYAYLMPILIEPIFNTFTPLTQTQWAHLEGRVRTLIERADVPVKDIMVSDASRQGNHTNAYFSGFGPTRRIVMYDTLLRNHTPDEVESVLAHELGHWQNDHIVKGMTLAALGALFGSYLLALLLRLAVGRGRLALKAPSDPAGLPLILLLGMVGSWLAMPLENFISRHFEREADTAALVLAGQPEAFIAAEKKLAIDNISNVAPLPLSVWLFASHPPPVERIRMAEEFRRLQSLKP